MTKQSSRAAHSVLANIPECYRDIKNWPGVDDSLIEDPAKKHRYENLSGAMAAYLQGGKLSDAAATAKVSSNRFLKLLRRCLLPAPDGRIWGCRALVLGTRVEPLRRTRPFTKQKNSKAGYQGVFGQLMAMHPSIGDALRDFVKTKKGRVRLNKLTFRAMHKEFLTACGAAGVKLTEYPFNTDRQAREPLRKWLKSTLFTQQGHAWTRSVHGEDAAQAFGYQEGDGQATRAYAPYCVWIIDETPIDCEAIYELPNARGDWEELELRRGSVIRVRDAGSGANLASLVVLTPQVSAADIDRALQRAILGSRRTSRALQGYVEGAGYPADVIAELAYALPQKILLDNALSHLADHVQYVCLFLFGGKAILGSPYTPQERSPVESSFSAIARRMLHQIPGTTGSGPHDPVRRTAAAAPKDRIRVDKLEEAIDAYCANENALPAAASHYISPLERLRRQLASGTLMPVYLPPAKRQPHYFCKPARATVRWNPKSGRRPYINYLGARYSSSLLRSNFALVGSAVWVRADFDDLGTVLLFDAKGSEIGPLQVLGQWGKIPHDLRIRKLYLRLKKRNELGPRADDEPLICLFNFLRERAGGNKSVALQLTYLVEFLRRKADETGLLLADEFESWEEACKAADDVSLLPQLDFKTTHPFLPVSHLGSPTKSAQDDTFGSEGALINPTPTIHLLPSPATSDSESHVLYVRSLARRRVRR